MPNMDIPIVIMQVWNCSFRQMCVRYQWNVQVVSQWRLGKGHKLTRSAALTVTEAATLQACTRNTSRGVRGSAHGALPFQSFMKHELGAHSCYQHFK